LMHDFEKFGQLDGLKLINQKNGQRRFAFVTYKTIEQAITARHCLSKVYPWKSAISFAHKEYVSSSSRAVKPPPLPSTFASNPTNPNSPTAKNDSNNNSSTNDVGQEQQQVQQAVRSGQVAVVGSGGGKRLDPNARAFISSISEQHQTQHQQVQSSPHAPRKESPPSHNNNSSNNGSFSYFTPAAHPFQAQYNHQILIDRQQRQHHTISNSASMMVTMGNAVGVSVAAPTPSFLGGIEGSSIVSREKAILIRLCDDTYVPTQPWPVDPEADLPICRAVADQISHFGGSTTISKLRGFLKHRVGTTDNIKSVPLKAMLAAYANIFRVDGNYVSLISSNTSAASSTST